MKTIRLAPNKKAIPGCYRVCEEVNCPRLIPTPHVRCQEHRTDFAVRDHTVPHFEPDEVDVLV